MHKTSERTQMLHARIEPKLKRSAERVFVDLGLSTSDAIRLFLRQVELHKGLPFLVSVPNRATIAAMKEANHPERLKRYGSFKDLRKTLS